jgi:hypothetical protein
MKIAELEQPMVGDIIEFETEPDTVVEGKIIGETPGPRWKANYWSCRAW